MDLVDTIDIKILSLLQGDLPITRRPYHRLALQIGIPEEELLERIVRLKEEGVIREVKVVLKHQRAGFSSGAMVAWAVPDASLDEIAERIALNAMVSHCYERPGFGNYPLFTMIHGRTDTEVDAVIQEIASDTGIHDYRVYRTLREFKKTSAKYFSEGQQNT
ncbi:MAG: AsnC family transcriptional regulator [Desulfomonilia bacterium]|nr:AsnC family transcriptional regulator [Desulfomonilia bacterium]